MTADLRAQPHPPDPPTTVWIPPTGDLPHGASDNVAGVPWWVLARLVSQFAIEGRAAVVLDGLGSTIQLSRAVDDGATQPGLVILSLATGESPSAPIGSASTRLGSPGCLAVALPPAMANDGLPGGLVARARATGLIYLQHLVVVDAAVAGDTIQASQRAVPNGPAVHLRVHRDVLIFTQPTTSGAAHA